MKNLISALMGFLLVMGCGLGALAVHAESVETTRSSIVEQTRP